MTPVIQQRVRFRTAPRALSRFAPPFSLPARPLLSAARPAENSWHLRATRRQEPLDRSGLANRATLAGHSLEEDGLVNSDSNLQGSSRRCASRSRPRRDTCVPPQGRQQGLATILLAPVEETLQQIRGEVVRPHRLINRIRQDTPAQSAKNSVIPKGVCAVRNSAPSHVFCAMTPSWVSYLAPTNELHNLQLVPVSHPRLFPLCLRQDLQVVLNRHASRIQSQLIQQLPHRRARRRLAAFPVHLNHNSVGHGLLTTHTVGTFGFARNANRKCPSPSCFTARIASAASAPPIFGISNSICAWPDSPASAA